MTRRLRSGSRRRGVEAVEFAIIFPLYLVLFFGVLEYGWFMFQKASVADAVRQGCQSAGQADPATTDYRLIAAQTAQESLERLLGITCNAGGQTCAASFPFDGPTFTPPRLTCEFRMTYVPLTGLLGGAGSGGVFGVQVIPSTIIERSVTIFENAEPF
jgi:Flp pilus assembly protein TadG